MLLSTLLELAGWVLVVAAIAALAGAWWAVLSAGVVLVGYGIATDFMADQDDDG